MSAASVSTGRAGIAVAGQSRTSHSPSVRAAPQRNRIGNAGAEALANAQIGHLTHLNLERNGLSQPAAEAIATNVMSFAADSPYAALGIICAVTTTLRDTLQTNVTRPNRVYEKLKAICKHLVHGRQEDAHEFLRFVDFVSRLK